MPSTDQLQRALDAHVPFWPMTGFGARGLGRDAGLGGQARVKQVREPAG